MSMSSVASGVATSPQHQHQLPPLKQIRFVNNEGQPPAKRRRINAACVFSSYILTSSKALFLVLAHECSHGLRIAAFLVLIFNRTVAERVENERRGVMARNRSARLVQRMDTNVWAMRMWVREVRRGSEKIAMLGLRRNSMRTMMGRTMTISKASARDRR